MTDTTDGHRLRWGILGCGDMANKATAPAIHADPRCELLACHRRHSAPLTEFADRHHVPRRYSALEDLLADPDIDAVYIGTPPALHRDNTLAALEAGKHVLCEKPMAMTVEQCREMVDAAEECERVLGVGYYRRLYPQSQKALELLQSGAIGKLRAVHSLFSFDSKLPADQWRLDPEIGGGGMLMDVGSHRLDLMVYLAGEPMSVTGHVLIQSKPWQVDDAAQVSIRFADGALGLLALGANVGDREDRFELWGSKGAIIIDPLHGEEVVLHCGGETTVCRVPTVAPGQQHMDLVRDFTTAVLEGGGPICPGNDGLQASWIMQQAVMQYHPDAETTDGAP